VTSRSERAPGDAPEPTTVASVYAHAPFCARRCLYCDFAVTVRRAGGAGEWIEALRGELRAVEEEGLFALAPSLETLYVGGGTPSLLGSGAMAGLAEVVGPDRLGGAGLEWTAEANPESLTSEIADGWAAAGVNRISLGAQSFHEPALRWMGRLHGPDGPGDAIARARRAGIDNLSVDLIFGLPPRLGRDWRADLERVLALEVPHVSLYGLTVESATPLGRAVGEGREQPVDDVQYEDEFLLAADVLEAAGYEHYEVSSFARPGARARHNGVYWTGAPYLGLGNGAHSFAPPVRRWNERDWEEYRPAAAAGRSPEAGREWVDADSARLERIWLGLRTREGLCVPDAQDAARSVVEDWAGRGLAHLEADRVRLTAAGWLVLDRIAVDLDEAWERLDPSPRPFRS